MAVQSRRASVLILTLSLVLASLAQPTSSAPAATVWDQPLALADPSQSVVAVEPALAVDETGAVHVLWYGVTSRTSDDGDGLSDVLFYRVRNGAGWSSPEPIFSKDRPAGSDTSSPISSDAAMRNPRFALQSALASAPDGKLHVAVGSLGTHYFISAPWSDVVRMALLLPPASLGEATSSALAAGDDGTLHVLLTAVPPSPDEESPAESSVCADCTEILYRQSEDGMLWTRAENLSRIEGQDLQPQVATDAQGGVHAIWEHYTTGSASAPSYLLYRRSTDGGKSWQAPVQLGVPGEGSLQPVIGAGPGGSLLTVYGGARSSSVFFQVSPDGGATWSAPGLVPGVVSAAENDTGDGRFSLAADGAGRLHLLLIGAQPASVSAGRQLLHLTWDGQVWSSPTVLTSSGPAPGKPQIRISRGNRVHAVWYTTETDPDGSKRQVIWYSGAPIAAPELQPRPTFTPIPTRVPTAAPTAVVQPTATVLPVATRELAAIEGPPRWEGEALPILFIAVGPALALLGVVVWWASRRGRRGD